MLPEFTVPPSLQRLLNHFWPCFTRPTFATFSALVTGMIAQTGRRTVCGMLTGAGLARLWHHDRAHAFFSRRRWDVHHLGTLLAGLIAGVFTTPGQDLTLAIDDTLIKRTGAKVHARARQHDGARSKGSPLSWGVCFIVAALVVKVGGRSKAMALPVLIACHRPNPARKIRGRPGRRSPVPQPDTAHLAPTAATARILAHRRKRYDRAKQRLDERRAKEAALPAGHRLPGSVPDLTTPLKEAEEALNQAQHDHDQALARVRDHTAPRPRRSRTAAPPREPTKTEAAISLAQRLAETFPDRTIHVVADAAYHNPALRALPATITWTFRIADNTALSDIPPPPGGRGRPAHAGPRLGTLADIAAHATFTPTSHDHPSDAIATIDCRWPRTLGPTPLRLILIRAHDSTHTYDLALLTTDTTHTPEEIAQRYADRWPIETTFQDTRAHLGLEHAQNRTRPAVERTVPLQFLAYSLVVLWHHHHGHPTADIAARKRDHPWYTTKTEPAFSDMIAALRRTIIKHRISHTTPDQHLRTLIEEITLDQTNIAA